MDDSASGSARGTTVVEEVATTQGPSRRRRGLLAGLGLAILTAVVAWLFGNLPWVVSGFSWPTTEAAPVGSSTEGLSGVRLTIPLVAAYLPSLIAFTAIGSVAAALLPLVLTTRAGRRLPAIAVVLAALVVTTVLVVLVARSTIETHAADAFAGDSRVLLGLVLVVLATAAVGALLGTLASVQVGFLPLAAAFAAGQVPVWLDGFLVDNGPGVGAARALDHVGEVLVLLLLLVAFVLSVRRSPWWALLWPVAVAMVWTATPFRIMTIQLAGQLRPSAGLPDALADVLQGGLDVFRASYWEAPQARWPWAVALVLALLWMAVERRTSTVATAGRQ